jgi:hypothetical protein
VGGGRFVKLLNEKEMEELEKNMIMGTLKGLIEQGYVFERLHLERGTIHYRDSETNQHVIELDGTFEITINGYFKQQTK